MLENTALRPIRLEPVMDLLVDENFVVLYEFEGLGTLWWLGGLVTPWTGLARRSLLGLDSLRRLVGLLPLEELVDACVLMGLGTLRSWWGNGTPNDGGGAWATGPPSLLPPDERPQSPWRRS